MIAYFVFVCDPMQYDGFIAMDSHRLSLPITSFFFCCNLMVYWFHLAVNWCPFCFVQCAFIGEMCHLLCRCRYFSFLVFRSANLFALWSLQIYKHKQTILQTKTKARFWCNRCTNEFVFIWIILEKNSYHQEHTNKMRKNENINKSTSYSLSLCVWVWQRQRSSMKKGQKTQKNMNQKTIYKNRICFFFSSAMNK